MSTENQVAPEAQSDKKHQTVTVTYNGQPVQIEAGNYSVEKLRKTLRVPTNDILAEFINGSFQDLTHGHVEVKGGEIFASHVPQGGAAYAG